MTKDEFRAYQKQWTLDNQDKVKTSQARYRDKERERCRLKALAYRNTTRGRADRLVAGAKQRATKLGLEFDLTVDWLVPKIDAGVCEATGHPFTIVTGQGRHAFAPSLDRLDPSRGYLQDNVRVTLWCFNAAKGIASDLEVLSMARALVSKYDLH